MEHQQSFTEITELIRNELVKLQKPRIDTLKLIMDNVPKEFAVKLHDNYLGVGPTRATLSATFHDILNDQEREELLQILAKKRIDDPEKQMLE
ncbi:hypothetical protein [Psychroserpens sp.]|jgi:HD superfamily phosphohydrolase YqeK|uniref:hypothetical protein n=1 Tax=Psychroserpens sp. TaxID=2020870 RepID=UPI0039E66F88